MLIPQSINYLDPLMKVSDQVKLSLENKKKQVKYKEIFFLSMD